jgi:hypothetical protein
MRTFYCCLLILSLVSCSKKRVAPFCGLCIQGTLIPDYPDWMNYPAFVTGPGDTVLLSIKLGKRLDVEPRKVCVRMKKAGLQRAIHYHPVYDVSCITVSR